MKDIALAGGFGHKVVSDHEGGEQAVAAGAQAPAWPRLRLAGAGPLQKSFAMHHCSTKL